MMIVIDTKVPSFYLHARTVRTNDTQHSAVSLWADNLRPTFNIHTSCKRLRSPLWDGFEHGRYLRNDALEWDSEWVWASFSFLSRVCVGLSVKSEARNRSWSVILQYACIVSATRRLPPPNPIIIKSPLFSHVTSYFFQIVIFIDYILSAILFDQINDANLSTYIYISYLPPLLYLNFFAKSIK